MINGERKEEKKRKRREKKKKRNTGDNEGEQVSIQLGRCPVSFLPSGYHPNGQS